MTIYAIYENGVFRPIETVDLPDRCTVEVEVRQIVMQAAVEARAAHYFGRPTGSGGVVGGRLREPGPIRKILTHLGKPLEPPPVSPARGPPTDWGELVQIQDDRDVFQATDRRAARDRHPKPLTGAGRDPRMSGNCELGRGLR